MPAHVLQTSVAPFALTTAVTALRLSRISHLRSYIGIPVTVPVSFDVNLLRETDGAGHTFEQWEASITPQINRFRGLDAKSRTYLLNGVLFPSGILCGQP